MTEQRIREWVREYGEDGVYVSFSGGKDSTVLLDIVRNRMGLKEIPAVFFDTGLEFPEIREFVKMFDNVVWIKPKMTFKQVIEKYGYPFISKDVSNTIAGAKKGQRTKIERLNGIYKMKNGDLSSFNMKKWNFLLEAPFEVNDYCCNVMKKYPAHHYESQSKRYPIIAQLAEESRKRTQAWMHTGCNAFTIKRPQSNPMAFWTEQDVLKYIKEFNIPICSVYGDIVPDYGDEQCDGQLDFSDFGLLPDQRRLKTTGFYRTGCMFCGFGCAFSDDSRFVLMKTTHPKQYEYIMKPKDQGGLGYKEIIDWINEHGDLNIKY